MQLPPLISRTSSFVRSHVSRKNALLLGVVAATAAVVFVLETVKPEPEKRAVTETAWPITVERPQTGEEAPEVSLYGRVETPRTSTLQASGTDHVAEVLLREGQWAGKGQAIVCLDPVDAQLVLLRRDADLAEAAAAVLSLQVADEKNTAILARERNLHTQAVAKVARRERLRQQKSILAETLKAVLCERQAQAISLQRHESLVRDFANRLARAEAGLERAQDLREEAAVALERTVIAAPFDGRISGVQVSVGERVSPGTPIAGVFDVTQLEVRAQLPAAHAQIVRRAIAAGQQLTARVNGAGGTGVDGAVTARLMRLSATVDTGRPGVDGLFEVADRGFELGRAVNLTLVLPPVAGIVKVPVQSIYGHDRLFLVEDERLVAVEVACVGERQESDGQFSVLVRSERLRDGGLIMTSQLSNAISGLRVEVNNPAPELAGTP